VFAGGVLQAGDELYDQHYCDQAGRQGQQDGEFHVVDSVEVPDALGELPVLDHILALLGRVDTVVPVVRVRRFVGAHLSPPV
jgi:hypothetical protein